MGIKATVKGDDFVSALKTVIRCVSKEETHYYLNGVYFRVKDGKFEAFATDGHRLARALRPATDCSDGSVIVETRDAKSLALLIEPNGLNQVHMEEVEGKLRVKAITSGFEGSFRPIDGTYPDVDVMLAQKGDRRFTMRCGYIMDAMRSFKPKDSIHLRFRDELAPVFMSESSNGSENELVVMPMRVA